LNGAYSFFALNMVRCGIQFMQVLNEIFSLVLPFSRE
jgi:hypothetical protein